MSKSSDKSSARKGAVREFLIGAVVAIVGGVMTYISYQNARPGEKYTIYTGIIVLGAIYAIKGLYGIILPLGLKSFKHDEEEVENVITEDNTPDNKDTNKSES